MGVPSDEVCINGRFVYTAKRKPVKAGHTKTESYVDDQRRLDARFCAISFQEEVGGRPRSDGAIARFKSCTSGEFLSTRNFIVMEVSGAF